MHIIRQHQTSITLFERNGDVVVFRSMKEAIKKLGYSWIRSNVGPHFRIFLGGPYINYQYILRNDVGETVTAESFADVRIKPGGKYPKRQPLNWDVPGPVPFTGRCSSGHYFRSIRYINAKRAAQYVLEEGEIAPRASRTRKVLPDAWDDFVILSRRHRSWKQFRRTQWR